MTQNLTPLPHAAPQWMVVYITYNVPEGHIVAGRLQSYGIPAMVHQALGASAFGITIGSLGEVRVLVHAEHYDEALALLAPDDPDLLTDDTERIIYDDDEE